MSDVLARICADKSRHIAERKAAMPAALLEAEAGRASPPRGFARALRAQAAAGRYGLIAEIKKASPSKGVIRADFDPVALAQDYERGGATCLSVLTDAPHFQGADEYLVAAREAVSLPVLRKDFMLDPYQVLEARALGADCILLIMAAIDDATARELAGLARELGMDVLVEVHDRPEMERALALPGDLPGHLIGINNRNLKTLKVDLQTTLDLAPLVTDERLLVSESGLDSPADLARMAAVGARCFLIGESFMRQADVALAVRTLMRDPAPLDADETPDG